MTFFWKTSLSKLITELLTENFRTKANEMKRKTINIKSIPFSSSRMCGAGVCELRANNTLLNCDISLIYFIFEYPWQSLCIVFLAPGNYERNGESNLTF